MKTTELKTYSATITIGLHRGYSNILIDKKEVIKILQNYQNKLIIDKDIHLSASVSECLIVLSNQQEPHLKLDFINYPKFSFKEKVFKSEINALGKYLMNQFEQNRIVIVYHDKTVMFEIDDKIDHRINQNKQ